MLSVRKLYYLVYIKHNIKHLVNENEKVNCKKMAKIKSVLKNSKIGKKINLHNAAPTHFTNYR